MEHELWMVEAVDMYSEHCDIHNEPHPCQHCRDDANDYRKEE